MACNHSYLALLILGLFTKAASAQFDALPEAGAQWTVDIYDGPNLWGQDEYFLPTTIQDTTINGERFIELFEITQPLVPVGAIRDTEVGEVFYHCYQTNQTQLLYSFEVSVGDTLTVYNMPYQVSPMYVVSVDTIVLSGASRRRIGIATVPNVSAEHYWIQGIGGTGGIISTSGYNVSLQYDLKCMSWNDTLRYGISPGSVGQCFTIQSVHEQEDTREITAYPNPSNGVFSLSVQPSSAVQIFDGQGNLVTITDDNKVDLSNYSEGLYQLVIPLGNRTSVLRVLVIR